MDATKDAAGNAIQKTGDALEKAGDAAKDAADKAADAVKDIGTTPPANP